jgi:hypothetical protein
VKKVEQALPSSDECANLWHRVIRGKKNAVSFILFLFAFNV